MFLASGPNCKSGCSLCQGEIHRQGELLKSGCSTSSGCFYQVRVLIFVRVNYSSQGDDNQVKLIRVKFFIRVLKSKSGGFCTNFTAGQEAKKVVTGNAAFMEKQCGPYKIKVHKCLAKNGKNQQRYLSTPGGPCNKPKVEKDTIRVLIL